MSEDEDWRFERAQQLQSTTDWTCWPKSPAPIEPTSVGDVLPMQFGSRPSLGAAPGVTRSTSVKGGLDPNASTRARQCDNRPIASGTRSWRYLAAGTGLLGLALGASVANLIGWRPIAITKASPVATALARPSSIASASLPAAASTIPSRCTGVLAAPALGALLLPRAVTSSIAPPARLSSVRQLSVEGRSTICRGTLELEILQRSAGLSPTIQIVSGPVDYAVAAPVAGEPMYSLLSARSIQRRLASLAVPAALPVATVTLSAPSTAAGVIRSANIPTPRTDSASAPQQVAVSTRPKRSSVVTTPPPVPSTNMVLADATPPDLVDTHTADERAADSDAARAAYGEIAQSGESAAIAAADEGRDNYLRRSSRCTTSGCARTAYRDWLAQLRDIAVQTRDTNY